MNKARLTDGLTQQHALLKGRRQLVQAAFDKLTAEIEPLAAELDRLNEEIAVIDNAILLFNPGADIINIRPRIKQPRITPLPRGAPLKHALKLLRDSQQALTTVEIMDDVLQTHGQENVSVKVRESIRRSINRGLEAREAKGWIRTVDVDGGARRWQFVPKGTVRR